jgi:hypothetical protein
MAQAESSRGNPKMVTGLFMNIADVERVFHIATGRGYDACDINVVMSDETRQRYLASDTDPHVNREIVSKAADVLGGPTGGDIGVVIPILAAGAVLALPGLGLFLAGPIAAALAGAGVAGLAVGLIGALGDWGISHARAQEYEAGIRAGGIVMGVRPRSDRDARFFEQQWKASGAQHVHA